MPSKSDRENLELKKKQISLEDEEKKKAKADKVKKVLIDMDDIFSRAQSLVDSIFEIKKASDLSDQDVRQHLLDSKRWDSKIEDIVSSKVKVDKDIIGAEVDSEAVGKVHDIVEKVKAVVKEKTADLKKVDGHRCLYSLSKAVKEVAVYPKTFTGSAEENVHKFKEKMIEAIRTNQIREKDKVEVLRKHLGGRALKMVGEHFEKLDDAFEALLNHYGLAKKTWDARVKKFLTECKHPQAWVAHGTEQRSNILNTACQFLREAEKLSSDHPDIQNTIISHATNEKIFEVIPKELIEKIQELGDGPGTKEEKMFKNIKTILNKQHQLAIELTLYPDAM